MICGTNAAPSPKVDIFLKNPHLTAINIAGYCGPPRPSIEGVPRAFAAQPPPHVPARFD